MARDTLTVPCTGAGVERQFSKSRRATPWTRARLSPETFGQIMMYKDYLHRKDQPNLEWHGTVDDMEELRSPKRRKMQCRNHVRTRGGKLTWILFK